MKAFGYCIKAYSASHGSDGSGYNSHSHYEFEIFYPDELKGKRVTFSDTHDITLYGESTVRDRLVWEGDIVELEVYDDYSINVTRKLMNRYKDYQLKDKAKAVGAVLVVIMVICFALVILVELLQYALSR